MAIKTGHMEISEILKFLPHRYPFLLVDKILTLETGLAITAIKNVSINEPFFVGHFPQNPIMPGVLILEAMAQAGGILAYASWEKEKREQVLLLVGMDKVRFRSPVVPGDQLVMKLEILKQRARVTRMRGTANVNGNVVAESEFTAVLKDKEGRHH